MKSKKMWSVLHIWYYHGIMCHKIAQPMIWCQNQKQGFLCICLIQFLSNQEKISEKSPEKIMCAYLRSVYQEVMVMILLTRASRMALITAFMDWVYPVTTEKMEAGKPRQDMITSCPLKWAFRLSAEKISASTTWKRQTGKQVTLMWILLYIYFS